MINDTPRLTMPTRPLVGGRFRYVPAAQTDIRVTFEKFQRLQRLQRIGTLRQKREEASQ